MYKFSSYYLDDNIVCGRVFDVFEPEKVTRQTALFFVHGGGWTGGKREHYHQIMQAYCRAGFICCSTDYRLLPIGAPGKMTAVDQLKDVREAYDAFVSILKEKGLPLQIAVKGSSAGAHLASLLVCAAPGECQEDCTLVNEWVKPFCGLLQATPASFEPWDETYPAMWGMLERAAGGRYEDVPEKYRNLSLCRYIREDNPPLFFIEAGNEGLFPGYYNAELLKKHQQWGIASELKYYRFAEHGFFYDVTRPCQQEAFRDVITFIEKLEAAK